MRVFSLIGNERRERKKNYRYEIRSLLLLLLLLAGWLLGSWSSEWVMDISILSLKRTKYRSNAQNNYFPFWIGKDLAILSPLSRWFDDERMEIFIFFWSAHEWPLFLWKWQFLFFFLSSIIKRDRRQHKKVIFWLKLDFQCQFLFLSPKLCIF